MKFLRPWLFCLLLALPLWACSSSDSSEKQDILSQKPVSKDKIAVTILVKNAFSIENFEREAERKFPQLDIIQVGNYTRERGIVEYQRRLQHDDLTDIVMTWPLKVGEEYWNDRLIDLSSMPFTSKYNNAMLNRIAKDGKLYYLPGPAQVRGIVYNKTLFEERGWKVPHDFTSFVALCKTIESSGMRALQLGFANPEVLDTAFVGFSYGTSFSSPVDAQWLADYNSGKGSFGSHFAPALQTFQTMIDAGIWKKEDLAVNYADREQMFFNRKCAMVEDSMILASLGRQSIGSSDKFALMPFFSEGAPSDWARLYMVCYIGLNKHLTEPANKKKYTLILELMDYISSPEGQMALAADTGAMYSSVKSVPPPNIPEIALLANTLRHGRYGIFPTLSNAQAALRQGLEGMLNGSLKKADVVRMVDQQNVSSPSFSSLETLGTATADFSLIETGNFITDAMRAKAGADVALYLDNGKDGKFNGKGLSGRWYKGPQTMDDVLRVLADLKHGEAGVLQLVTMKGKDLIRCLEYAITVNKGAQGWFYYFSGLKMEYAPVAVPGSRIHSITSADGKAILPQQTYTVAVMDSTVPSEAVLSVTGTGFLIQDVVAEAIRAQGNISPSGDRRFVVRDSSPKSTSGGVGDAR